MPLWSHPSAEPAGSKADPDSAEEAEMETMRRRFVEALRRAEIISLLAGAEREEELGRLLTDELCEVYDAEVALLVVRQDGAWRSISTVGIEDRGRLLDSDDLDRAEASDRAIRGIGEDLLGIGARSSLLASAGERSGRRIVLGVGQMFPRGFDAAEIALLETVVTSTAQSLDRLWTKTERLELINQLKQSLVGTAEALANALEAKDNYTADHASEVAELAVETGKELGLDEGATENLRYGAIFHDIGKIAIPDAILHKPGPLADDEWEVMKGHPVIGAEILAPIPFLDDDVRAMVRHDHESFDGSGYPDGLSGEEIPLGARIILVVDSFHAMTSDRPYRAAMSAPEAIEELRRCSGSQFDSKIVEAFVRVLDRGTLAPSADRSQT